MHAVITPRHGSVAPSPSDVGPMAATSQATIWMTGRRGSGRRTLARAVVAGLAVAGRPAVVLDDARIAAAAAAAHRSPAGVAPAGRVASGGCRRDVPDTPTPTGQANDLDPLVACAAELAMTLAAEGVVAIVVATSPRVGERERIRREHERRGMTFVEVFVDTPPAVSAARDIADPGYEEPPLPDLVVRPGPLLPAVLSIVDLV